MERFRGRGEAFSGDERPSIGTFVTITQASEQLKSLAGGLTRKQRVGLAVSAVVVAAIVAIFVHLVAKPEYQVLYSGLDPNEGRSIARHLAADDVPYELSSDATTLSVPSDKLNKVRFQLAEQGLPHTGQLGFELFDKPNWGSSDFVERVNYERALEGELERTIESIDGVESARVHLALPQESLFSSQEQPAKAAVVLRIKGGSPSQDTLNGIQHLVASAVPHLSPHDVSIINADGEMPFSDASAGPGGQRRLEARLNQRIIDTLAPIVGADHLRADVNVEENLSSADDTSEVYDPQHSAVLSYQRSGAGAASAASTTSGVPGTASNLPNGGQPPGTSLSSQLGISNPAGDSDLTESQTFAVSRTVSHRVQPPGSIKRLTAAVLIDDQTQTVTQNGKTTTVRQPMAAAQMNQIRSLVMAAIGFDPGRGDQVTVENIPFQQPPPAPVPHGLEKLRKFVPQMPGLDVPVGDLFRYGALALLFFVLYILLLRPLRDQFMETMRSAQMRTALTGPTAAELPSLDQEMSLDSGDALAGGFEKAMLTGTSPEPVRQDAVEMEAQLVKELNQTSSEVKRAVLLKKHLSEKVRREPMTAGRIVHNWIRQRDDRR